MGLGSGLFGAAIGGLFGGPLGAIIGGSIGLILSAGMEKKASSGDRQQVTINILSVVFQCLGKLAKSDGRVSEDEAEYIRELLHSMVPDADIRKLLIAEFNSGRDSSETFDSMVKRLANLLNSYSTFEFKTQIMYIFCTLTVVDRQVDKNEFEMLKTAGMTLGCPEVVDRFFAGYQYRQQNNSSQNSCSSAISLQQCYALLDISETASDMEVKKAYRKKAMECHPDKAQAAGLSAVMIEEAKKKFQDISNAYETIRKARNMQ